MEDITLMLSNNYEIFYTYTILNNQKIRQKYLSVSFFPIIMQKTMFMLKFFEKRNVISIVYIQYA